MKAKQYDGIKLARDVEIRGIKPRFFPRGVEGVIVECYTEPVEGYDVDLNIPDSSQPSGYAYDNVTLTPDQFDVISHVP